MVKLNYINIFTHLHLLLIITCFTCCVTSENVTINARYTNEDDEKLNLYKDILGPNSKYLPIISPSFTNVSLSLVLTDILRVDVDRGLAVIRLWIRMIWKDSRLSWNSTNYGSINELTLPASEIWTPDIVPLNSVDPEFLYQINARVTISSDGTVIYVPSLLTSFSFEVDRTRYYDRITDVQSLIAKLGSWTHDGNRVAIYTNTDKVDTSQYVTTAKYRVEATTWKINKVTFDCCPAPHYEAIAVIDVKLIDMN